MSLVWSIAVAVSFFLPTALAQDASGFSGTWERNEEQSDDAREKMQEAMSQMRGQGGGGGRPSGGGSGRRGGGGQRGGAGGGGPRGGGGARPEIGNVADTMTVELTDGELHIDDGERLRIYYLDGETHKRETANGMKLETIAEHRGNAVFIEETMDRGQIDRKFELSPEGTTLIMTVTVKFGQMKDPVIIKTVYEKAAESTS